MVKDVGYNTLQLGPPFGWVRSLGGLNFTIDESVSEKS